MNPERWLKRTGDGKWVASKELAFRSQALAAAGAEDGGFTDAEGDEICDHFVQIFIAAFIAGTMLKSSEFGCQIARGGPNDGAVMYVRLSPERREYLQQAQTIIDGEL